MSDSPAVNILPGLTAKQCEAAGLDGDVLVLAGTGKTRTLTAVIVRRIRADSIVSPRILAVTFINRAESEMSAWIKAAVGWDHPRWSMS